MADNWGFVLAAYGLAAVVLLSYWRFLARHERTQTHRARPPRARPGVSEPLAPAVSEPLAPTVSEPLAPTVSEPLAPTSGHPRSKPASRPPLQ